ncbi:MAG TPA: hypothetical protein VG455_04030 [Acidimicrobiales bacterium]|nr:hypothetical protein [Acidimicrobiales bacterium]
MVVTSGYVRKVIVAGAPSTSSVPSGPRARLTRTSARKGRSRLVQGATADNSIVTGRSGCGGAPEGMGITLEGPHVGVARDLDVSPDVAVLPLLVGAEGRIMEQHAVGQWTRSRRLAGWVLTTPEARLCVHTSGPSDATYRRLA